MISEHAREDDALLMYDRLTGSKCLAVPDGKIIDDLPTFESTEIRKVQAAQSAP